MNEIKDTNRLVWTEHAKHKVRHYQLSSSKIRSIIDHPERREEAIVEGLFASMRTSGSRKHRYEIWTMYAIVQTKPTSLKLANTVISLAPQKRIKIISAWRYPGKTEPGKPIPIPDDTIREYGLASDLITSYTP
ncbi:MAG: hypothetical protein A2666_05025 [Parcubacteria group bacterium RIFCSPHIGHO2_01_FULL_47_10b]|nr:MAG: hypothetical protein A2666_05025 [Parcubacteria group bacterium RIFCSPHIGHO2_01_FULL_47_10b]